MAQRPQQDSPSVSANQELCEEGCRHCNPPEFASRLTAQMSAHMTSWANHRTPIALRKHAAVMRRCAVFIPTIVKRGGGLSHRGGMVANPATPASEDLGEPDGGDVTRLK